MEVLVRVLVRLFYLKSCGGPKPTPKPKLTPKPPGGGKPTTTSPSGNRQVKPRAGNPRLLKPVDVPEPPKGNLAGGKPGSQLLKGGPGRSTNRIIAKLGGKNALKATKALKNTLGRIPVVGSLITALVSLLSGDPIEQTLFKTGEASVVFLAIHSCSSSWNTGR